MAEEVTQGTGAMNLILTRKEKLCKNLKIERNLGGKNQEIVKVLYCKVQCNKNGETNTFRELVGWIF